MLFQKNSKFQELILSARSHKEDNLPFVLYQNPNEDMVKGVFVNSSKIKYTLNFSEEGFVFFPFKGDKAVLLSCDKKQEAFYERDASVITENLSIDYKENKELHIELVNRAITEIKKKQLQKVVVSRKIEAKTQKDEFQLFQDLLNRYPNAFKYLWFHPKIGIWIGATPEILLKVEKDFFTTTSIAGTIPIIEGQSPEWSSKEIEEQQLVTDYILDKMTKTLTTIYATPASTIRAGKLWHLKSVITGFVKEKIRIGEIISIIHPTPAVCGIPLEASKEFIRNHENYDREFYTGFLGELNFGSAKQTHLFVNLRCMKFKNKKATIFIGGGITEESNPNNEWEETQYKGRTLLNLL